MLCRYTMYSLACGLKDWKQRDWPRAPWPPVLTCCGKKTRSCVHSEALSLGTMQVMKLLPAHVIVLVRSFKLFPLWSKLSTFIPYYVSLKAFWKQVCNPVWILKNVGCFQSVAWSSGTNTVCCVVMYSDQHVSSSSLGLRGQKEMDWHTFWAVSCCTASATQQCEFEDLGHSPLQCSYKDQKKCFLLHLWWLSKLMQSLGTKNKL